MNYQGLVILHAIIFYDGAKMGRFDAFLFKKMVLVFTNQAMNGENYINSFCGYYSKLSSSSTTEQSFFYTNARGIIKTYFKAIY